ncbi:MAG: helix-hairpin-helix domain-containing protein, partial [Candidatus Rokuibacteriota bacterium]
MARALREIGQLLAASGGEAPRVRAYARGARAIEALAGDLDEMVRGARLTTIPGIGRGLAAVITELHRTGRSGFLEDLRGSLPRGVLELRQVPGLGLAKIRALSEAGIDSVATLRAAAEAGTLARVPGFGDRAARNLLAALAEPRPASRGLRLDEAHRAAEHVTAYAASLPGVERVETAGALRRAVELVDGIEVVASARAAAPVIDAFVRFPPVTGVVDRSPDGCRVRLADGVDLSLHVVPPPAFVVAVHRRTGSARHLARLEHIAETRGLVLEPLALRRAGSDIALPVDAEPALYRALGLEPVPPELREDQGEIEAAAAGTLPADLLESRDLRGLVHCHTVYSDGTATIEEMARAADALGMDYITITDHSAAAHYANGLGLDRLAAQWDEIARVQERVRVRLLRGTECDILADGAFDYPDAILEQMDVIIASVHARHRMNAEQMTRRLLRALSWPVFKIWGHARGRLIPSRPPFECDMDAVLDGLAASRGAVEVNGDPRRLDMEPRWLRAARERGIPFVVSTDAHSVAALANDRYGVAIARRG